MAGANKPWFKPLRHSYIACSYNGALTYIPYVAYLVFSLLVPFDYLSHKVLAVLIVIPNWIIASQVMTWLAKSKS
jgi:uncharacterized membrane protein